MPDKFGTYAMSSNNVEFYLLAAGKGERMGGSKPLLTFGPTTVFERMVRAVREAGIEKVRVVGTSDNAELAKLAFDLSVRYVLNLDPIRGMSGSIVDAANDCTSAWLALCPADMPLLTSDAIAACAANLDGTVVQPACGGRRKHPVFIHLRSRLELISTLTMGTLRDFIAGQNVLEVEGEPCSQFEDFDSQEDFIRLLSQAGFNQN